MDVLRCEGQCNKDGDCTGEVMAVRVFDETFFFPPLEFNYCATARTIDRRNGFRVDCLIDDNPPNDEVKHWSVMSDRAVANLFHRHDLAHFLEDLDQFLKDWHPACGQKPLPGSIQDRLDRILGELRT